MSSFFKTYRTAPTTSDEPPPKRARPAADPVDSPTPALSADPTRIICWNCNGLSARLRSASDTAAIKRFLVEQAPDVLFLSEVRLPAAHNAGNRKPSQLTAWFRSRVRDSDPASSNDFALLVTFLRAPECRHYRIWYSLADHKYSGTAMLLNTLTTAPPSSIRFNMDTLDVKRSVHHPQGRVIFAKFASFSILHTYVPNNGWGGDHFTRRHKWDDAVLSFMKRKKDAGVRIMWIGDLNVAPHDDDLSDPAYFRKQTSAFATRKRSPKPAPQDVGAPGCTDRERDRFSVILRQGMLVDAFAHIRPADHARIFTWRAVSGGFGGRAMRIDHCIVSHPLLAHVRDVVVLGHNNLAGFMGSDHCPVLIVMHARTHSEGQGDAPAPVAVRARPAHAVGDAGHLSDAAENEDKASDTRDAALNEGVGSSDWNSSKQAEDILDANSSS